MIKDTDKIKEIPLFSKGALVFKESKHKLVKNGDYYRCAFNANGICALKNEKLVIDWRKKLQTRADVRLTIEKILDELPPAYTKELWQNKCDATYQQVYECYYGQGASVYGSKAS